VSPSGDSNHSTKLSALMMMMMMMMIIIMGIIIIQEATIEKELM
jgi:hypothetical protein